MYASSRVGAMSHTAPAGRPKVAQSAARVPPERQPDPLCGALLQCTVGAEHQLIQRRVPCVNNELNNKDLWHILRSLFH